MKKFTLLALLFVAISSCSDDSSGEATQEAQAESKEIELTADTEKSNIQWTDGEGEHTGYLKLSEGSVKVKGESIVGGNLTVDMNSVSLDMEGASAEKLLSHLKNEDFFNVEKFSTANVSFGELKDGKLSTTITFLGVSMTQDVPVTTKVGVDDVSITGTFGFDFMESKMPYITPDDKGEVGAPSVVDFKIDLSFKK